MVLTQPITHTDIIISYLKFPYHYGSYATIYEPEDEDVEAAMFPYHYGSYATIVQR